MLSLHSGKSVVSFGVRPAPGNAALGIHDDVVRLDQPGLQQRGQSEDDRRGIAARIGDQLRGRNRLAEQFRQAVDDFAQPVGVGMFLAVPLGIDVGAVEAVVGGEVNDPAAGGQQGLDKRGTGPVRQATEHALRPGGDLGRTEILQRQVKPVGERGMNGGDVRIPLLAARDGNDLGAGMTQQNLDQFDGRVAGGTQNGDPCHGSRLTRSKGNKGKEEQRSINRGPDKGRDWHTRESRRGAQR